MIVLEHLEGPQGELDGDGIGVGTAYVGRRMAGAHRGQSPLLQQYNLADTLLGQEMRRAGSHDAAADHHCICCLLHSSIRPSTP